MTLREFSALVSAILVIVGTIWYIYVAIKGDKVKPILTTWIVFGVTTALSFVTYWTSPRHSLVSNACNTASVVGTLSIFSVILWINIRKGERIVFSRFQKWCLGIYALITVFWVTMVWGFNGTGTVPNICTQTMMIVGYVVTAEKLWSATKNTESFFTWNCTMVASAIAVYTGIVSSDTLATVYATRSMITSASIVWLMYRIERQTA